MLLKSDEQLGGSSPVSTPHAAEPRGKELAEMQETVSPAVVLLISIIA